MKQEVFTLFRIAVITLCVVGFFGATPIEIAASTEPLPATAIVDFDADGKSDIMLYEAQSAQWNTYGFYSGVSNQYFFGSPDDRAVVGDYDGDGMSDFAVCQDDQKFGTKIWNIQFSQSGRFNRAGQFNQSGLTEQIHWGIFGDVPVPADYDGDGKTDFAVFRPSSSTWYIYLSGSNLLRVEQFGTGTDKLVPADYDGDGTADIAIMRPSNNTWYIRHSIDNSDIAITWDVKTNFIDVLVPADYDGDGHADIAVYKPASGFWVILESVSGFYRTAQFGDGVYTGDPTQGEPTGNNLDLPMPGDFDGDGVIDIAVWSSGTRVVNVLPSQSSLMTSIPVGTEISRPVSLSVIWQ